MAINKMFDKILNIERIEYKSSMSANDFKSRLNDIFNQRGIRYNLSGKFTNEAEFKATNKWTIGINIRSFERDPAYLKGIIKESKEGIIIDITVRPNSIFPLFTLLFTLVGLYALISTIFVHTNEDTLGAGIGFILIGIIPYYLGKFLRYSLKNRFEKYIGLKESMINQELD